MYSEYDNERFFMEYAKMARSRDGLRFRGRTFLIWDAGTAGTADLRRSGARHRCWDLI